MNAKRLYIVLATLVAVAALSVGAAYYTKRMQGEHAKNSAAEVSDTSAQAVEGSYTIHNNDPLLESHGKNPFESYKKRPEILSALKELDGTFTEYDMNVSTGNRVAVFSDGRKMLYLSGCFPHACVYTWKMALYDPDSERMYLATLQNSVPATRESSAKYEPAFLGDPDPLVLKFLHENVPVIMPGV